MKVATQEHSRLAHLSGVECEKDIAEGPFIQARSAPFPLEGQV